jgi:hypothetical protein
VVARLILALPRSSADAGAGPLIWRVALDRTRGLARRECEVEAVWRGRFRLVRRFELIEHQPGVWSRAPQVSLLTDGSAREYRSPVGIALLYPGSLAGTTPSQGLKAAGVGGAHLAPQVRPLERVSARLSHREQHGPTFPTPRLRSVFVRR